MKYRQVQNIVFLKNSRKYYLSWNRGVFKKSLEIFTRRLCLIIFYKSIGYSVLRIFPKHNQILWEWIWRTIDYRSFLSIFLIRSKWRIFKTISWVTLLVILIYSWIRIRGKIEIFFELIWGLFFLLSFSKEDQNHILIKIIGF